MRKNDNKLLEQIYELIYKDDKQSLSDILDARKKELKIKSDRQLSAAIGIQKDTLNRIIKGESNKVDLISIIKISNFLGIGVEYLVKVYVSTLKPESIREIEYSRKSSFILRNFDLQKLKSVGWINTTNDFDKIEEKILRFFEIETLYEYESELASVLFSKTKIKSNDLMLKMWLKSAYIQFQKINNPNEYVREDLEVIIPKIRPYTRNEKNGLTLVVKSLYQIGITVVIQQYLTGTQVKGATIVVNDKPCIVLTNFQNRYDILWFSLLHELYHVLYDLNDLRRRIYHVTGGESDLFLLNEEMANDFARQILFSDEKLEYINSFIDNKMYVDGYAEQHSIHPSIIYGFYSRGKPTNVIAKHRKKIIKSDKTIQRLKTNVWDKDAVSERLDKIKQLLEK